MGSTETVCTICGAQQRMGARFCDSCGSTVTAAAMPAEFKQVTVLFADVVRSMNLASLLDAERLREIMTTVFNSSSAIVQRYGGTVDKFTGDGIMALFGAPVALEDHAVRACLAALDIQGEIRRLAATLVSRDGVALELRIGLNSGRVITGDIHSGPGGYTAVGAQVGLAERMESAAPPGGILLSASTAALVESMLTLGDRELISTKDSDVAVPARRLVSAAGGRRSEPAPPRLIGRDWELGTLRGILGTLTSGNGTVVGIVGPPGIGKSRLIHEASRIAADGGADVFRVECESHTNEIPFHAVSRLLRNVFRVDELNNPVVARARVRAVLPSTDSEDLTLFDDLLGVRDPDQALPDISARARQGRLLRLINAASSARTTPAVYIVEDAHWIDEVSEAMFAAFAAVIAHSRALVLITYRPEYRGELSRLPHAHRLALTPLNKPDTTAFISELLGNDPSLAPVVTTIAERADGNPFFAQEIIRDLAERGVLTGGRSHYTCPEPARYVYVPATVQSTIAARIDRIDPLAKQTLAAASVIGTRFGPDLLGDVLDPRHAAACDESLAVLMEADLVDQVQFTPKAEYSFRHPMTRTVAYESQLVADRAQLHRRLATAIERRYTDNVDENASLIAEHLHAAGELRAAFEWHMRAGGWSTFRDILAAKTSWQRARDVADLLPDDDPDRLTMRIAPRTLLCGNAWRVWESMDEAGFDELRELTNEAGDKLSMAIGMAGLLPLLHYSGRIAESARLASECVSLIESINDAGMTVALLAGPMQAKFQAGEARETTLLAERAIELADGDPTVGNLAVGSPLAIAHMFRGGAAMQLGRRDFCTHFDTAIRIAKPVDVTCWATTVLYKYSAILSGVFLSDDTALADSAEALSAAENSGDGFAAAQARLAHGVVLLSRGGPEHHRGLELLTQIREMVLQKHFSQSGLTVVDIALAQHYSAAANHDQAIAVCEQTLDRIIAAGDRLWPGAATCTLVAARLARGADGDLSGADVAVERLAQIPVEPGYVLHELPLLRCRALLAKAQHDESAYRQLAVHYRTRAAEVGFLGHLTLADAM
jgi:adenylate cyclase